MADFNKFMECYISAPAARAFMLTEQREQMTDVILEKAPQNVSYEEYRSVCKACEVDNVRSEETWTNSGTEQRTQMLSTVVGEGLLNKADSILGKED